MSKTEQLTVEVSASLAEELKSVGRELLAEIVQRGLRELRIDQALEHYRQGGISFGAAAVEARLSQAELARQAYARDMEPPFSGQTLAEELA